MAISFFEVLVLKNFTKIKFYKAYFLGMITIVTFHMNFYILMQIDLKSSVKSRISYRHSVNI